MCTNRYYFLGFGIGYPRADWSYRFNYSEESLLIKGVLEMGYYTVLFVFEAFTLSVPISITRFAS